MTGRVSQVPALEKASDCTQAIAGQATSPNRGGQLRLRVELSRMKRSSSPRLMAAGWQPGSHGEHMSPSVTRMHSLSVVQAWLEYVGVLPLADDAAFEARSRWRILEEGTRDQSYRLDANRGAGLWLTGDPDVDALLTPYVRAAPIGAA
jgi:hypothetical protein